MGMHDVLKRDERCENRGLGAQSQKHTCTRRERVSVGVYRAEHGGGVDTGQETHATWVEGCGKRVGLSHLYSPVVPHFLV